MFTLKVVWRVKIHKFLISIVSLLLIICLLSSCNIFNKNDNSGTFFMLKDLPEYNIIENGVAYYDSNSTYTDKLVASKDYGEIMPFLGGYYKYDYVPDNKDKGKDKDADNITATPESVYLPLYGLCTVTGKVIVNPVYTSVEKHMLDNGDYIYELVTGADATAKKSGKHYLASSTGSWVVELSVRSTFEGLSGNDRIIVKRMRVKNGKEYKYHDFYNYNGVRMMIFGQDLAEIKDSDYTIGNFTEGLAPVTITTKGEKGKEDTVISYYVNITGNRVSNVNYRYCGEFYKGLAIVIDENGKYGVIKPNGEYLFKPEYRIINFNKEKELFTCSNDGYFTVNDITGKEIRTVLCDRGNVEIVNSDKLIYKKTNSATNKSEYFVSESDKPFVCKKTGQFPDENSGNNGVFWCSYSNITEIFDDNGETIVNYTDFGSVETVVGNLAIVTNSKSNAISILNLTSKDKTDWITGSLTGKTLQNGKYVILTEKIEGKPLYSVYDIEALKFIKEKCDYIDVINTKDTQQLITFKGGNIEVFNGLDNCVYKYTINAN